MLKKEYSNYTIIKGGKTRKESSYFGLKASPNNVVNVLIHDTRGRLIKNLSFNPQIEITIPCKELARGSYVLNISTSNKQYSANIIKQ